MIELEVTNRLTLMKGWPFVPWCRFMLSVMYWPSTHCHSNKVLYSNNSLFSEDFIRAWFSVGVFEESTFRKSLTHSISKSVTENYKCSAVGRGEVPLLDTMGHAHTELVNRIHLIPTAHPYWNEKPLQHPLSLRINLVVFIRGCVINDPDFSTPEQMNEIKYQWFHKFSIW